MLPEPDNGSRFFFLFPLYCLTDVRVTGETPMVILRRNIPTCLPLYNQANIGQRDCPCLQIVWHPARRRTVGGVLGYPFPLFCGTRASPDTICFGRSMVQKRVQAFVINPQNLIHKYCERRSFLSVKIPIKIHGD